MADLGGARQLLPQGNRAFAFANPQPDNREKQKNYVFVDEHNRHRRLKVMRACGACRRRKIKCDAATTNSWPCAACQKQHLECVPPSSDKDGQDDLDGFGMKQTDEYQSYASHYDTSPDFSQYSQSMGASGGYDFPLSMAPIGDSTSSTNAASSWSSQLPNAQMLSQSHNSDAFMSLATPDHTQQSFRPPTLQKHSSTPSWRSDDVDPELADALQDLKIDQGGVAPYITNNHRNLAEGPAIEENEVVLPPSTSASHTASIPHEMMPPETQAMQYVEYFFGNIHPYVPVVNRSYFYRQWNTDRTQISPLILEGIFACSAQMMQKPDERSQWMALASRHEESFKDVPRLSTIQGMILILKAREAVPKRGYYYRSWMTCQYLIAMAKDLGLDDHNRSHIQGHSCGLDDCAIRTRIWHTLFQIEMMVGGPQGRTDFSVDMDSVNSVIGQAVPGVDESEVRISQDQIHMVRIVKNIRQTSSIYTRARKSGTDLADDPDFVRHNTSYYRWTEGLPRHLQIDFKANTSAPWIPFHFAANLHCYHWLGVIMQHRPQLQSDAGINDRAWKHTIITCYSAATKICRLHEAILEQWGLNGLLCMLRGINTAIYTILTCTMLHLVAITSPDPELNTNAKDYFTRHMRILEQCSSSWPMPAIQVQIDSIRQAFSANLKKPFELRPNFPFGSPAQSDRSSPPNDFAAFPEQNYSQSMSARHRWSSYDTAPLTPPSTASTINGATNYSTQVYNTPDTSQQQAYTQAQPDPQMQWDPSAVFDRWTTAFNTAALESPSPGLSSMQPINSTHTSSIATAPTSAPLYPQHNMQTKPPYAYAYNTSAHAHPLSSPGFAPRLPQMAQQTQAPIQHTSYLAQNAIAAASSGAGSSAVSGGVLPYVTPSMWQDTVARSYGEGMKRHWNDGDGDRETRGGYKRMR